MRSTSAGVYSRANSCIFDERLARVDDDARGLLGRHVAQHALREVQVLVEERRRGDVAGARVEVAPQLGQVLDVALHLALGGGLGHRADDEAAGCARPAAAAGACRAGSRARPRPRCAARCRCANPAAGRRAAGPARLTCVDSRAPLVPIGSLITCTSSDWPSCRIFSIGRVSAPPWPFCRCSQMSAMCRNAARSRPISTNALCIPGSTRATRPRQMLPTRPRALARSMWSSCTTPCSSIATRVSCGVTLMRISCDIGVEHGGRRYSTGNPMPASAAARSRRAAVP